MKAPSHRREPATPQESLDRVQEIISDEAPILFLVNPSVLAAVSPAVRSAAPSPLSPHLYWNIEHLSLATPARRKER